MNSDSGFNLINIAKPIQSLAKTGTVYIKRTRELGKWSVWLSGVLNVFFFFFKTNFITRCVCGRFRVHLGNLMRTKSPRTINYN
jgi:hypothetical protein